ncbi:MAG: hypothetical protein VX252_12300 [Myxococcota bacterium]|nr:hypothetical protein [Myxococcota bacterium]
MQARFSFFLGRRESWYDISELKIPEAFFVIRILISIALFFLFSSVSAAEEVTYVLETPGVV